MTRRDEQPPGRAALPDQTGRRVIVTGANAGLGAVTAQALASAGAEVIMVGRDPGKLESAADRVRAAAPAANVRVGLVDLADLASVIDFARTWSGRLDVLINNAGVMLVPQRELTTDGFERQMGVNHLGHFALTRELWPVLRASGGRVVSLSSIAHRFAGPFDPGMGELGSYAPFRAYAQSKLATALFGLELDRRSRRHDAGVVSVVAHPGYVATTLFTRNPSPSLSDRLTGMITPIVGSRPRQGARSQLRAATDPALTGGEFIGPWAWLRGRPVTERPSGNALDRRSAEMLWEISAEKTGGDFSW